MCTDPQLVVGSLGHHRRAMATRLPHLWRAMRRGVVLVFLIGIVAAIAWWLLDLEGKESPAADPWSILPVNTALVIEVPDPLQTWAHFTNTSQLWTAWDSTPGCAALNSLLASVQEAADADALLKAATARSPLLVALAPQGDAFITLVIWPLALDQKTLAELGPALRADLGPMSPFWHDGRTTIKPDASSSLELAYANGLLLMSDDAATLNDAMRTHAPGLPSDSLFQRARSSLGAGSDAHVLIHAERTQRLLTTWFLPEALRDLDGLSGWTALDVRLRPQAILFSGLYFAGHRSSFFNALEGQPPTRPAIARVLPASTRELRQVAIGDAKRFSDAVAGGTREDLFSAYGAWTNGALGLAASGSRPDSSFRQWAVAQAQDPMRATDALNTRCTTPCDTVGYRGIRITHCPDTAALASVWGATFDMFEHPWWCLLNDKVVFSDQMPAMHASIDSWLDGTSLAQSSSGGGFFQRYASEANFTWWANAAQGLRAMRGGMKERGIRELDAHSEGWTRLGGCLVQATPESEGVYQITACIASTGPDEAEESGALWSVSIGTTLRSGPFLLDDHLSRTKQILVQDIKQRISVISCTGKVMWQREIDGPILGEVQQVDRFKNGKLQMLFNTAGRLYLIDRNGKDVAPFPISLPEKASAPLSVFDYEGQKDYRVLLPTVEAHLLNYGADGRAVDGWIPPTTPATSDVPVQHLRIRGKDYLVLIDHAGDVTVLDRRGQARYSAKLSVGHAARLVGIQPALDIGACALMWIDSLGNGLSGTFDGAVDTLTIAQGDTTGGTNTLRVMDITSDGRAELVVWKNGVASMVSGALPYPADRTIPASRAGEQRCDIDGDEAVEVVRAFSNGRVIVERGSP